MPPRIAPRRGSGPSRGGGLARGGGAGRGGALAIAGHVKTVGVKRPGYGTGGRVVPTIVNAFPTTIPQGTIHHYDAITPGTLPSRVNMILFKKLQTEIAPGIFVKPAVYDGRKNAFTSVQLQLGPTNSNSFSLTMNSESKPGDRPPKVYTIKMTKVAEINTEVLHRYIQGQQSIDNDVLTAITALNVVIRMEPNNKYPFNVRSFFTEEGKRAIGGGLELWRGYFQSVRPSQDMMYINLDIATGVMYKPGPLLTLCMEYLNMRNPAAFSPKNMPPFPDRERIRLQKFISGMRIMKSTQDNRQSKAFVIRRITAEAASDIMFEQKDGRSTSVAKYFHALLNMPLKYPQVVCVEVGNTGAKIPLELCIVPPGQIMRKQIPADKTNDMLEFSKLQPQARLNSIKHGLSVLQYGQSEYIRQFGMNVQQMPITTNARILPPPVLRYGPKSKEATIKPSNGSWNMRDKIFFKPSTIHCWTIVIYEVKSRFTEAAAAQMVDGFIEGAKSVGMIVHDTSPLLHWENGHGDVAAQLMKAGKSCVEAKKGPPTLIVVVLPEGGNDIYTRVKHFGDVTRGVATQCLKAQKCRGAKIQYWANVMLKVNVKLGGINNILHDSNLNDPNNPCIVMGADVMHPAPGAEGRPSFASLVSSVDINTAKYIALSSVQVGRQEIISDLEPMVVEALKRWKSYGEAVEKRTRAPSRLIFYRDGVSESQFQHVIDEELPMIKNACAAMSIKPKITLIVVGKRHHIRMFPQNERDGDRSGNCQAGTTIDQGLGHPTEFDYYQLTHGGLLGTSRPAHYSVLYDDSNFNADALQQLSFSLCHVYARATRSVSIPAPVYYADIVCARAKNHYTPGGLDLDDTATVASSSRAESQLESFKAGYKHANAAIANSMYFM